MGAPELLTSGLPQIGLVRGHFCLLPNQNRWHVRSKLWKVNYKTAELVPPVLYGSLRNFPDIWVT